MKKFMDENFLMTIATIGAFGIAIYEKSGDYNEAVAVMLLYLSFLQIYEINLNSLSLIDENSLCLQRIINYFVI